MWMGTDPVVSPLHRWHGSRDPVVTPTEADLMPPVPAVVAAAAETAFTLSEVKAGTPGRPSILPMAVLSAATLAVRPLAPAAPDCGGMHEKIEMENLMGTLSRLVDVRAHITCLPML